MRLLFVADGRSPIAQNWIRHFAAGEHEVYLASTFACTPDFSVKGMEITPVAFSGASRQAVSAAGGSARGIGVRSTIRHWAGPLTIPRSAGRLRRFIQQVKPDLVHAMRIPYEGMMAADAYAGAPLLVSVWGNDFTLHARSNGLMEHYTAWTMQVADALHTDCQRDIRLAKDWGFDTSHPTFVAPGNGGVEPGIFHAPEVPVEQPVVINPRGFRTYVRNDTFFRAIPKVLAGRPNAKFLCVGMQGEPLAVQWIRELGIAASVELLPAVPHSQMGDVFRQAQVTVSLGVHDGTPNTLLEGMACGCLPVAGELESIREWIRPGKNGLLANANEPESVGRAILEGLNNKNLRLEAAGLNEQLIAERANYGRCMEAAERFYGKVISAQH